MGIFGLCHCLVDYLVFFFVCMIWFITPAHIPHTFYIITLIRYYKILLIFIGWIQWGVEHCVDRPCVRGAIVSSLSVLGSWCLGYDLFSYWLLLFTCFWYFETDTIVHYCFLKSMTLLILLMLTRPCDLWTSIDCIVQLILPPLHLASGRWKTTGYS